LPELTGQSALLTRLFLQDKTVMALDHETATNEEIALYCSNNNPNNEVLCCVGGGTLVLKMSDKAAVKVVPSHPCGAGSLKSNNR
jgi:hypothetical protein